MVNRRRRQRGQYLSQPRRGTVQRTLVL